MIFFLVSASVPIDIRAPSWLSLRGAPGLSTWGSLDPRPLHGNPTRLSAPRDRTQNDVRGHLGPGDRRRPAGPWTCEGRAPARRPPSVVPGSCLDQTAGGTSLRACCSVVVWLPSGCVVVETDRALRPRFKVTAVKMMTRTPARTRIQPTVVRSTPLIESCTA